MADSPLNSSPDAPANQSTRQLLDELDALMQRMLALPVQAQDEEAAPAASTAPAEFFAAPTATVTVQALNPPVQTSAVNRVAESWPAPALVPPPPSDPEETPVPSMAAPAYVPLGAEPLLPLILQRSSARPDRAPTLAPAPGAPPSPPPEPLPSPRPAWLKTASPPRPIASVRDPSAGLRVLIAINRSFDRGTGWLGGAGRWLRSEQGRGVLGWVGVAMLGAALVWAAVRFLG